MGQILRICFPKNNKKIESNFTVTEILTVSILCLRPFVFCVFQPIRKGFLHGTY